MFSELIVGYLFFGGAGAGLLVLLCALEFANASQALLSSFAFPIDFFERAWVLCAGTLGLAAALLIADLGIQDRLLYVFAFPTLSPLSIGAYALLLSLVVAFAFILLAFTAPGYPATTPVQIMKGIPRTADCTNWLPFLMHVLEALGVCAGVVVMTYTGVLLAGMSSVLAWETPLLPAIFVLSSGSCGIALVFFAASFTDSRQTFFHSLRAMTNLDTVLIAFEAVLLFAYTAWCFTGQETKLSAHALIDGPLAPLFWGAIIFAGLIVPTVLERFITRSNYRTQLMWVAGGVLFGGFALRYCIVGLAAFDPSMAFMLVSMG